MAHVKPLSCLDLTSLDSGNILEHLIQGNELPVDSLGKGFVEVNM